MIYGIVFTTASGTALNRGEPMVLLPGESFYIPANAATFKIVEMTSDA